MQTVNERKGNREETNKRLAKPSQIYCCFSDFYPLLPFMMLSALLLFDMGNHGIGYGRKIIFIPMMKIWRFFIVLYWNLFVAVFLKCVVLNDVDEGFVADFLRVKIHNLSKLGVKPRKGPSWSLDETEIY